MLPKTTIVPEKISSVFHRVIVTRRIHSSGLGFPSASCSCENITNKYKRTNQRKREKWETKALPFYGMP